MQPWNPETEVDPRRRCCLHVRVETTTHAHQTIEAGRWDWDCTTGHDGTVYAFFCCATFGIVKIGYTRKGQPGVLERLAAVRDKRALPGLETIGTVDGGERIDPDGWALEEAMRLWLVHRHHFRWHPWQDWLVVPAGMDSTEVVRLLIAARNAAFAWLGIEDDPVERETTPGEPRT